MRAAAARQWWAARRPRRQRSGPGSPRSDEPLAPALTPPPSMHIARGTSLSLVLLAAATIAFAVIGFAVTQWNDRRLASEQHAALTTALDELEAVFGDTGRFDGRLLRLLEERSGLKDLRFGADPETDGGREIQSLQDAHGRIVGWFSWAPDRALIRAMGWLWAFCGAAGIALIGCALIGERATRRLARSLRSSIETTRKLQSEDVLTGLPNQRVMLQTLDRVLAQSAGTAAFALIDVDGLREVNETTGRAGGDAVLRAIAERLRAALPAGALLGRFEDDEFAAVAADDVGADSLAAVLRTCFAEPFAGGEASSPSWQLSAGIGLVQAPDDGTNAEELSRRAALALRAAKRDGHGAVRRFDPQIELEQSDRRFLLRELKTALAAQAFDVHYQPIVAAAGGAVIGVEALSRWTHPTRGAIAPAAFIPLAEQYGVMRELGELVLRRALADAARWPHLFVAINLSPVQIRDPRFVDLVAGVLAQTGVAASRVVLEMTEGILIDDPQETHERLQALRALGVSMALDDFGTGYSSLSYLQKFPFQRLKIDRTFVAALGSTGDAGAIIHSIVTLGHALGMAVLGEGVETDQQRVLLRLAGCDEMQGFLFAKPLPAAAIDRIVQRAASGDGEERSAAS